MLRVNIRTPLKVIFGTKNIIGGMFRLSTQYVSQLLTVLNQKLNKTVILTCRCSICIENESTGKYTCSHAPYTRFTSVIVLLLYSCLSTCLRHHNLSIPTLAENIIILQNSGSPSFIIHLYFFCLHLIICLYHVIESMIIIIYLITSFFIFFFTFLSHLPFHL